jgi:hypothetical protein
MKCKRCDEEAVSVNLTIPADLNSQGTGKQEIVGCMEKYCLRHFNQIYVYGLTEDDDE